MRLHIIAVGRFASPRGGVAPERLLFEDYQARLAKAGFPLTLKEVEEKRPISGVERMRREGQLLLNAAGEGAHRVTLDPKGKTLSSEGLADWLGKQRDGGVGDLAFLIGGADGLDDEVLAGAGLSLSLGAMTWPHMMVRPMLAEQLYRATCILAGHPYHRG